MSSADPFATAAEVPVSLVQRNREHAEVMLVTANNHAQISRWVRSKGGEWHTHAKGWGKPGLGVAANQYDSRAVEDGDMLVWTNHFFAMPVSALLTQWQPLTQPEATTEERIATIRLERDAAAARMRQEHIDELRAVRDDLAEMERRCDELTTGQPHQQAQAIRDAVARVCIAAEQYQVHQTQHVPLLREADRIEAESGKH